MRFFLQDEISEQVDHIIRSFNKLMDGDVSEQMEQKGLTYKVNYGTSILLLRQQAQKYKGNNELANRLWYREIREAMIMATLIAEPDAGFEATLKEWLKVLPTNEMAEQTGANLLWRLSDVFGFANELLDQDDAKIQALAWVGLACYLQRSNSLQQEQVDKLLSRIGITKDSEGLFLMRCKGRFLRQLCRQSHEALQQVEEVIVGLKENNIALWLVEEVSTEIDFLKNKD
jgi:hypothetical protein